jgi:hypothetical protein
VTAAVVVTIGLVATAPASFCTQSTSIASPLVLILKPTDGLASVEVICTLDHVLPLICEVISVQLVPSCVKEMVPVPVLRLTYAEAQRTAEASVIGWRMMASAAPEVRVVAVLAMPSRPVAVLAAVIFVLVDHAALLRSLEYSKLFVAAV